MNDNHHTDATDANNALDYTPAAKIIADGGAVGFPGGNPTQEQIDSLATAELMSESPWAITLAELIMILLLGFIAGMSFLMVYHADRQSLAIERIETAVGEVRR